MKKKILIPLIAMVIVIAAVVVLLPNLFLKSSDKNQQKAEAVDPKVIFEDYNKGNISIDDYVKMNIDHPNEYVSVDWFIANNIDQLSESTLEYYLEQINLPNVTFDPEKENTDEKESNFGLFAKPVYAAESLTNLNKVVLSSNGNFLVWYTTTGKSAITKEKAEEIANELETSIERYKDVFGYEFKYESNVFTQVNSNVKYLNKWIVLKTSGIDIGYLDSAMQVYVLEYDDSGENSTARYVTRKTEMLISALYQHCVGHDFNESIQLPYIMIRTSALSDRERANQVLNHELFHHYQYEILDGHSQDMILDKASNPIKDELIFDSTANWASALITSKDSLEGFLNEWASTSRKYADRLLSDDMIHDNGKDNLSYALFVYLYNYSTYVDNGTKKILKSIYEKDSFAYLYENATLEELAQIQEEVALKDLSQDYSNKNLIAAPSYYSFVPMKERLLKNSPAESHFYESTLDPLAIEFYEIGFWDSMAKADLEAKLEKNNNIAAYLIRYKDGKYEVIDRVTSSSNEYVFDLSGDDVLYLAVANLCGHLKCEYKVEIYPVEKPVKETEPGDTNTRLSDSADLTPVPPETMEDPDESTGGPQEPPKGASFLSYETTSHWNEEILKDIETYYFDENDMVCYRTVTLYVVDEAIEDFYEVAIESIHLYTNVKREGNMIQYDYTPYALEQTHDYERSKDTIIGIYEYPGGYVDDGYVRTDYNPHE